MKSVFNDELQHHGILGQKWGIRRYQNYDGSYTRAGLKRYESQRAKYESAKSDYETKRKKYKAGLLDKKDLAESKRTYKDAKKKKNQAYNSLASDKKADEGKALYRQGETITSNNAARSYAAIAATAGSGIAYALVSNAIKNSGRDYATSFGGYSLSSLSATAVSAGIAAASAAYSIKKESENRKLRAYYGHS